MDNNVYKLVEPNHPILHHRIDDFDFSNPPIDPKELSQKLIDTMLHLNGIGLSANQCGLPYRVFVMRTETPMVCFNPKIIGYSEEINALDEGCLSHPFLYVKIKRPAFIRARFADETGVVKTEKFIGITSRCFQHEFDHLEGINYLRRANVALVERAKRDSLKIQKRLKAAPRIS